MCVLFSDVNTILAVRGSLRWAVPFACEGFVGSFIAGLEVGYIERSKSTLDTIFLNSMERIGISRHSAKIGKKKIVKKRTPV